MQVKIKIKIKFDNKVFMFRFALQNQLKMKKDLLQKLFIALMAAAIIVSFFWGVIKYYYER